MENKTTIDNFENKKTFSLEGIFFDKVQKTSLKENILLRLSSRKQEESFFKLLRNQLSKGFNENYQELFIDSFKDKRELFEELKERKNSRLFLHLDLNREDEADFLIELNLRAAEYSILLIIVLYAPESFIRSCSELLSQKSEFLPNQKTEKLLSLIDAVNSNLLLIFSEKPLEEFHYFHFTFSIFFQLSAEKNSLKGFADFLKKAFFEIEKFSGESFREIELDFLSFKEQLRENSGLTVHLLNKLENLLELYRVSKNNAFFAEICRSQGFVLGNLVKKYSEDSLLLLRAKLIAGKFYNSLYKDSWLKNSLKGQDFSSLYESDLLEFINSRLNIVLKHNNIYDSYLSNNKLYDKLVNKRDGLEKAFSAFLLLNNREKNSFSGETTALLNKDLSSISEILFKEEKKIFFEELAKAPKNLLYLSDNLKSFFFFLRFPALKLAELWAGSGSCNTSNFPFRIIVYLNGRGNSGEDFRKLLEFLSASEAISNFIKQGIIKLLYDEKSEEAAFANALTFIRNTEGIIFTEGEPCLLKRRFQDSCLGAGKITSPLVSAEIGLPIGAYFFEFIKGGNSRQFFPDFTEKDVKEEAPGKFILNNGNIFHKEIKGNISKTDEFRGGILALDLKNCNGTRYFPELSVFARCRLKNEKDIALSLDLFQDLSPATVDLQYGCFILERGVPRSLPLYSRPVLFQDLKNNFSIVPFKLASGGRFYFPGKKISISWEKEDINVPGSLLNEHTVIIYTQQLPSELLSLEERTLLHFTGERLNEIHYSESGDSNFLKTFDYRKGGFYLSIQNRYFNNYCSALSVGDLCQITLKEEALSNYKFALEGEFSLVRDGKVFLEPLYDLGRERYKALKNKIDSEISSKASRIGIGLKPPNNLLVFYISFSKSASSGVSLLKLAELMAEEGVVSGMSLPNSGIPELYLPNGRGKLTLNSFPVKNCALYRGLDFITKKGWLNLNFGI